MAALLLMSLVLLAGMVAVSALRYSANKPKRQANKRRVSRKRKRKKGPYAAVAIVFDKDKACPEVMKLSGQRLLASEAPKLPLPECSVKPCSCSFHRYSDRRKTVVRRGVIEQPYAGTQKRGAYRGRRADDTMSSPKPEELEKDLREDAEVKTYYGYHDKTNNFNN